MVKLNKIYTRTGDDGSTGLTDGSRVPKHSPRPQAYGSVDELNSSLGMVYFCLNKENSNLLHIEIKNLIRKFLAGLVNKVCVDKTCSTSDVPIPKASDPKAPCVDV